MANCVQCDGSGAGGQEQLCGACRLSAFREARRKYHWTPELVEELRLAYAAPRDEKSARLARLAKRTGWRRSVLSMEAMRRGIALSIRRWTAEEDEFLQENVGRMPVRKMAAALGRTNEAIEGRLWRLRICRRDRREGYTADQLRHVFGVSHAKVSSWLQRGLFGQVERWAGFRVTESSVVRFIRRYAAEYDLRQVDADWFKSMVFGQDSQG